MDATNQGHDVENLFRGVTKKSGGRPRVDFQLARFACYLVAMNDRRAQGGRALATWSHR